MLLYWYHEASKASPTGKSNVILQSMSQIFCYVWQLEIMGNVEAASFFSIWKYYKKLAKFYAINYIINLTFTISYISLAISNLIGNTWSIVLLMRPVRAAKTTCQMELIISKINVWSMQSKQFYWYNITCGLNYNNYNSGSGMYYLNY